MGKTYVSSEAGYISEAERDGIIKQMAGKADGEHTFTVEGRTFSGRLNSPNGDREFTVLSIGEAKAAGSVAKKAPAKKGSKRK